MVVAGVCRCLESRWVAVVVYVFGFMNNPGLFWVPMLVKIFLIWLFLNFGFIVT